MYFYNPSPLSLGYILRDPYRPVLDRRHLDEHALFHAFNVNLKDPSASERPSSKRRRLTHSEPTRHPVLRASEVTTFDGLLKLLSGARPQPHSPLQEPYSTAPSQPTSAEPQPWEKQDTAADSLSVVLEFIHDLAVHAKDVTNGSETIPKARYLSGV